MDKHTPGPWRDFMGDICADHNEIVICAMNRSCGARSSEYYTYKAKQDVAKANARLIAAAPDLLAAAKDAQTSLSSIASGGDWGAIEEIIDALAAAIAKAEGRE